MNKLTKLRIKILHKRSIRLMARATQLYEKAESLDPERKKANEELTKASWEVFKKRMIEEGIFEKE